MTNGKRYWRLVALIPDAIAHETMSRVASTKGSIVEQFVPALVGPTDENGMPTSKLTGPEFLAQYAAQHRNFHINDAKIAAAEQGIGGATIASAVQRLRTSKQLKRAGKDKGIWVWTGKPAARPDTPSGRVHKGAGEEAVLERLARSNGSTVRILELKAAVAAAGGSGKSISGILDRLVKAKKIKRAGTGLYARAAA